MDWLTTVRAGLLEWTSGWKSIVAALGALTFVLALCLICRPASL